MRPDTTEADAGSECVDLALSRGVFLVCGLPLASFAGAQRDCRQRGGDLASIASAEENMALLVDTMDVLTYTNFWIGGTRDDNHVWRWPDGGVFWTGFSDGTAPPGVFVNWQTGEPNGTPTVGIEQERCASISLFGGTWRDRVCSLELSYFCEFVPSP